MSDRWLPMSPLSGCPLDLSHPKLWQTMRREPQKPGHAASMHWQTAKLCAWCCKSHLQALLPPQDSLHLGKLRGIPPHPTQIPRPVLGCTRWAAAVSLEFMVSWVLVAATNFWMESVWLLVRLGLGVYTHTHTEWSNEGKGELHVRAHLSSFPRKLRV